MDAPKPEAAPQQDDGRDDVQPIVQFDAIVHGLGLWWWLFAAVLGLVVFVVMNVIAWKTGEAIVLWPACTAVVVAGLVGLQVSRAAADDARLGAAETMAALLVTIFVALIAAVAFDRVVLAGPIHGVRGIGVAAAMFLIGAAVAFALRRATCVAGQRIEREPDAAAAARLLDGPRSPTWGLSGARVAAWFAAGIAAACACRLLDGHAAAARIGIACIAPVALGLLCGPRIGIALCVGYALGLAMSGVEPNWEFDTTPARLAVVAALAAGGLALCVRSRKRLRADHERLLGGERIRLEIGGLGTRLERMTPRTEQQLSIGICVLMVVVAAAIAAWALGGEIGLGAIAARTLVLSIVALCVAAGASFATARVGVGIVGGFALLLFLVPEAMHRWMPFGSSLHALVMIELVRVFVPVAIFGAALVTHLQSIGARVGSTPARLQRGTLGIAIGVFGLMALLMHAANGSSIVVFDRSAAVEFTFGSLDTGVLGDMYGTVAACGAGLAAALELAGLPGIVVVLGLALTRGQIVLVAMGCTAGWWLRRREAARGADSAPIAWRSGVLALALGELAASAVLAFL